MEPKLRVGCLQFGDWQGFLDSAVTSLSKTGLLGEFKRLPCNEDRIKFVRSHVPLEGVDWIATYFKVCNASRCQRKSAAKAEMFRKIGNRHFQNHQDWEALESYNECVIHAPSTTLGETNEKCLGLANRSAVLYHLAKYKECLADIEHALEEGYPEHLQHKLWLRRAQCQLHLAQCQKAKQALQKALDVLEANKHIEDKKKATILKDISQWQTKAESSNSSASVDEVAEVVQEEVVYRLTHGSGSTLVQASAAINLRMSPEKGRHLVANQPIQAGDTLIVERPFAGVLLPSHYTTHCHHCFGKVLAAVPCRQCCQVRYCSDNCQMLSWKQYHQFECSYLDLMHSVGVAHLSLRIVLVAGLAFLAVFCKEQRRRCQKVDDASQTPGLTVDGIYDRNYLSVYDLMSHTDDMEPEDVLQYTLTASLLLSCLKDGGFFNRQRLERGESQDIKAISNEMEALTLSDERLENPAVCDENSELLIGALLIHHICQLVCNAHAITELQVNQITDVSQVESQSQVRIATAIYPTACLSNHSCQPSFINSFHKDQLVVRAVKDIAPGEEIFNCYGPQFRRMRRAERQRVLKEQYFFECHCTACEQDENDEQRHQALKCPSCSGPLSYPNPQMKCMDCGHVTSGIELIQMALQSADLFTKGISQLEKGNISGALTGLSQCLKLRESVLYQHHRDLAETQDALARCHASRGNYQPAADYLSHSIKTTEQIFGDRSIELANELQKYAEVLLHCQRLTEANAVTDRALDLFLMHYGEGHSSVTELREMKSLIKHL